MFDKCETHGLFWVLIGAIGFSKMAPGGREVCVFFLFCFFSFIRRDINVSVYLTSGDDRLGWIATKCMFYRTND